MYHHHLNVTLLLIVVAERSSIVCIPFVSITFAFVSAVYILFLFVSVSILAGRNNQVFIS